MLTYIALKCQIKITVKDQLVTPVTPRIDIIRVQARIVGGMRVIQEIMNMALRISIFAQHVVFLIGRTLIFR